MCGIFGSININHSNAYLDLIKHRGPDGSGSKTFTIKGNCVNLLHRRLSIVDLSTAGAQPMSSYNNETYISFNGEIYNHLMLKERLVNIPFSGHSDTETIVNYFNEFGINNTLKELNGIFAFALLDLKKEVLYLARDRFGVKPLYYYVGNNKLLFSSEIRPLKAFLKPSIDVGSLTHSLRMRYTPSPSTVYSNIFKVEPGQLLAFDLKGKIALTKSYFVSTPKSLGSKKSGYEKLVMEYGDLFEKAVERQLMSDVEVGVLLSGGIDSALVASVAKKKSKTAVKAFTVGFNGRCDDVDETEYARQTASVLGLEHFNKKIGFSDFFQSLAKITEIIEEPIGTTSIVPMYFLSELAASKVKVVLSGQGADEPLGGYAKYRALALLQMLRIFRPLMPLTKVTRNFYDKNERIRRFLSSVQCADDLDTFIEFNAISSFKEVGELIVPSSRSLCLDSLLSKQNLFKQTWKGRTPVEAGIKSLFLYYDLRTSLADDLLMYTDKVTMHFSLECRVPMLDNELISFVESLDSTYKFTSKAGKIIHKDFARAYLPSHIIEREKLAFKSPTAQWFREYKGLFEQIFESGNCFRQFFNLAAVKRMLEEHAGGINLEKQLFLLLNFRYLLETSNITGFSECSTKHSVVN